MRLTLTGTPEWFDALLAGIVPTTPEAEALVKAIEAKFRPTVIVEATEPTEVVLLALPECSNDTGTVLYYKDHRYDHRAVANKKLQRVAETVAMYEKCERNVARTARALGVARSTVRNDLRTKHARELSEGDTQ